MMDLCKTLNIQKQPTTKLWGRTFRIQNEDSFPLERSIFKAIRESLTRRHLRLYFQWSELLIPQKGCIKWFFRVRSSLNKFGRKNYSEKGVKVSKQTTYQIYKSIRLQENWLLSLFVLVQLQNTPSPNLLDVRLLLFTKLKSYQVLNYSGNMNGKGCNIWANYKRILWKHCQCASTKKRELCNGDKAESELCHKWICRVLVKSLTPPHFLGLWPIGRRNAALIGTSPASYPHCS